MRKNRYVIATLAILLSSAAAPASNEKGEILAAMKKATRFMVDHAGERGGYFWHYSSDLTERWGEIPVRASQVWVQPPGTPAVGLLLMDAYEATGDPEYLRDAEEVGRMLAFGQLPFGGWHYFIDFDPPGIPYYYETVASQCWGYEEFYHYHYNGTFDDEVHTAPTRLLMRLYLATLDPRYKTALDKALQFVLDAQFPNGSWPQRFPLQHDYSSLYTFNDDVISGNIDLLWEAFENLGNPAYKAAALRGMDFIILSQMPPPQAGWGLQYGPDMKPAKGRNFEPAGITPSETINNIRSLQKYYKITGDRKYLRGIPDALRWLEDSVINSDPDRRHEGMAYTHASFYELGTNRPLYVHRKATRAELDPEDPSKGYWVDYEFGNFPGHYGMIGFFDIPSIRAEYDRVSRLSPEEARIEYEAGKNALPAPPSPEEIRKIISAMDGRGAWVETTFVRYYPDFRDREKGRTIPGIQTRTYLNNMQKLIARLPAAQGPPPAGKK